MSGSIRTPLTLILRHPAALLPLVLHSPAGAVRPTLRRRLAREALTSRARNMGRHIPKRFRISQRGRLRRQPDHRRLKLGMHRYGRNQPNRVMDLVADSRARRSDKYQFAMRRQLERNATSAIARGMATVRCRAHICIRSGSLNRAFQDETA